MTYVERDNCLPPTTAKQLLKSYGNTASIQPHEREEMAFYSNNQATDDELEWRFNEMVLRNSGFNLEFPRTGL